MTDIQYPVPTFTHDETQEVMVEARILYEQIGVATRFNDWIARRIQEYGFEEGEDYIKVGYSDRSNQSTARGGDRRSVDYYLTTEMAKELAMVENNDQGRRIRRQFIAAETEYRKLMQGKAETPALSFDTTPRHSVLEMWNRLGGSRTLPKPLRTHVEVTRRAFPAAIEKHSATRDYFVATFLAMGVLETLAQYREDKLSQPKEDGLETRDDIWLSFTKARAALRDELRGADTAVVALIH